MLFHRRASQTLAALFVLIAAAAAGAQSGRERTVRVTLLQVNDVYQISPVDRGTRGGLARVAALKRQIAATSPHTVLLLAGDTLSPSVASTIFRGRHIVEVWNAVGLDYAALGNHEFDFGDQILVERMRESCFPWLAANVFDRRTGKPFAGMEPFLVRQFGGVKVGFFGLLTTDTTGASAPGPDVDIRDPVETAARIVPEIRASGATVVVAITHLTMSEDKRLARAVPVDVIIGGHEHSLLQSLSGRTPIFKMGADARNLGRIDLNISAETGALESIDWEVIPVTADLSEDPKTAAVVAFYEKQLSSELDKPIGRTSVALEARQIPNRTRETNIGDLVADAIRKAVGADIALINGGSIRSDTTYGPGLITKRDILSILPFESVIAKAEVSGSLLRAALEHGVSRAAENLEEGRFPQVSGLRFTFDARCPPGSRVISVDVGGVPLVDAKTYSLATSMYLLGGGDGYSMLERARVIGDPHDGPVETSALITLIGSMPEPITPGIDGRIQRLDAPTGE